MERLAGIVDYGQVGQLDAEDDLQFIPAAALRHHGLEESQRCPARLANKNALPALDRRKCFTDLDPPPRSRAPGWGEIRSEIGGIAKHRYGRSARS